MAKLVTVGLALSACLFSACATTGKFVWVDDYAEPRSSSDQYVIAPGDTLNVRVFAQDAMSARVKVRPDGMISIPFLNDVNAAGLPPAALARQLDAKLKDYIKQPNVTVSLEEPAKLNVSVLGEVAHAGAFSLDPGAGVLQALAMAGGFTDYAHKDRVFVLRKRPSPARIRFTFKALVQGEGRAGSFTLRDGDTVVVE